MSRAAVINIRTEATVKAKAQKVAEKLGLNLSAVINAFLKQFIRTKAVSFNLSEEPSNYLLKVLKESKKDIEKGFVSPAFDDADEAIKWLNDPKRKYANQL